MSLIDEKREIAALHLGEVSYSCPENGSILVYLEYGDMASVVWFEIHDKTGEVLRRVNGKYVQVVEYKYES